MTRTYLEPEEVVLMEEAATNLRDRLLVRLLFRLGCRVSEALALRSQDIDFGAGTVRILHLKERLRLYCPGCGARLGRSHHFCPGCGKEVAEAARRLQESRRQRLLPVDGDTLGMLRGYVGHPDFARRVGKSGALRHALSLTKGLTKGGDDRLFPISRFQAWHIVRGLAHRVGLGPLVAPDSGRVRGVSPHRLRDAFAVNAVRHDDSGDGLRLLQEHLGHVSFNTTARYRKISGREQRQWYEKLWGET